MLINEFLNKTKSAYSEGDYQLIKYALDFAKEYHEGQVRASGEPYINHPIETANILVDLGMDVACVCTGLLHDVIEDTECDATTLKKKFGEEIFTLVDAVTKISKLKYKFQTLEEEQSENIRKLFFAISKDLRVIFIKLADRLHNMRTLDSLNEEKQVRIARETLDIYAPMAARLGISQIKCELEDLCMKYLYPDAYAYLCAQLNAKRDERMQQVQRIAEIIQRELEIAGIEAEIKGRPKHYYSIYKKMVKQNKTLDQIYDLIAVRVIVDDVKDCYAVLGIIHSMWKPVPGRFKDYIAMPKPNLYQSLHTTVVSNFGQIFEIQIRTQEMNRVAEYGLAAHWKYKEGRTDAKLDSEIDKKLSWVREVMEAEEDIKDSNEYLATFKHNIVTNEIYVFSPKGEVFDLATGATTIDFAYRVHSAVGNKCVGARVNNKMVPLNTVLHTGDVIEIITSNAAKGPTRDWLKFVVTSQAKSKIKAFFKKEMVADNIKKGKEILERRAKAQGFEWSDLLAQTDVLESIFKKYQLTSIDDMYASIGCNALRTNQVIIKLMDKYRKEQAKMRKLEELNNIQQNEETKRKRRSTSGIIVEGFDDFLMKIAKCCNPVPGDKIIGYAMRGSGVSIHRADCPNVKNMEPERLMEAHWADTDNTMFVAKLQLECIDKTGLGNKILTVISNQGISITSLELKVNKGIGMFYVGLQVKSTEELDYIIKRLEGMSEIISVKRT